MISSRAVKAGQVRVFDQDVQKVSRLRRSRGIRQAASVCEAVGSSDIIFLCVKPAQIKDVLPPVTCGMEGSSRRKIVVSIAAGIPLSFLESGLPKGTPVIRVMPNTPALVGGGMVVLSGGRRASGRDMETVRRFFQCVGEAVVLSERHMDAVTAVSGSGPAYVFYLCEAMCEACTALGLPPEVSELLCRQTVFGAGLMLRKLSSPAHDLRIQVTSPGGTTEAAVKSLEKSSVRRKVKEAIFAAAARSQDMGRLGAKRR
jgi:pyrroline-5-carboxylate reductase